MSLNYSLPRNGVLVICDEVLKTFHRFRQSSVLSSESGGILVGKFYENKTLIDKVTTPGAGDKRGVFFFHRHRGRAQAYVDEAFESSDGRHIYIGEWHTHRQRKPGPSSKDILEIERAFKRSRLNLRFMLVVIVGNLDTLGNIWVGYYDGIMFDECHLCGA